MNIGNRRMTRLTYELKNYQKEMDECNRDGIYIFQSSHQEDILYGLVVGPEDTPYQNGYLLIKIEFPNLYPFNPPKMTFISLDQTCRIHPNLYHDGYVCLSMINTWGSDEYSPGLSLIKILRTIQSILIENPIEGEPGHENDKSAEAINYREMVRYDILNLYQFQMVNDQTLPKEQQKIPIDVSEQVYPILAELFLRNYSKSLELIEKYQKTQYNGQGYRASVYTFYQRNLEYQKLGTEFTKLHDKLLSNSTL
jgi:ubiquitin-protein ligase